MPRLETVSGSSQTSNGAFGSPFNEPHIPSTSQGYSSESTITPSSGSNFNCCEMVLKPFEWVFHFLSTPFRFIAEKLFPNENHSTQPILTQEPKQIVSQLASNPYTTLDKMADELIGDPQQFFDDLYLLATQSAEKFKDPDLEDDLHIIPLNLFSQLVYDNPSRFIINLLDKLRLQPEITDAQAAGILGALNFYHQDSSSHKTMILAVQILATFRNAEAAPLMGAINPLAKQGLSMEFAPIVDKITLALQDQNKSDEVLKAMNGFATNLISSSMLSMLTRARASRS